jgi:hypothetical protein
VRDHRFHHRFFTGPQCAISAKDCEKGMESESGEKLLPYSVRLACDCAGGECLIVVRRI